MQVKQPRIAHVSTFPPTRCGIANFACDLIESLESCSNARYALHYGDWPGSPQSANVASPAEMSTLAEVISESDCDVVSLQHEFGIWGGEEGEHLHSFLDKLKKPLVSILHTTFTKGVRGTSQEEMIRRLVRRSRASVVLTEEARCSLRSLLGDEPANIVVIPHGLPTFSFGPSQTCPGPDDLRLITPGFFRENKGVDVVLYAIDFLRRAGWNVFYVLAGEAQRQFSGQDVNQRRLVRTIGELDLDGVVTVLDKYLTVDEQCDAIQRAHFGVFAYQDATQASSGTVPLVLGAGRPVICTPFEYAMSKQRQSGGVFIANGYGAECLAEAIMNAATHADYEGACKSAYDAARAWRWAAVGRAYRRTFVAALEQE